MELFTGPLVPHDPTMVVGEAGFIEQSRGPQKVSVGCGQGWSDTELLTGPQYEEPLAPMPALYRAHIWGWCGSRRGHPGRGREGTPEKELRVRNTS